MTRSAQVLVVAGIGAAVICLGVVSCTGSRSSADAAVNAITISIDKNGDSRIEGLKGGGPRSFSAAEFPTMLDRVPSVTSKTRITLSADRDVADGMVSTMREWLVMNGYNVVAITDSGRGDQIVLVSVRGSGECEIRDHNTTPDLAFRCSDLVNHLKQRFPDTARTEVSLGLHQDVSDEQANLLRTDIQEGGYKFGKAMRAFITAPER